VKLSEYLDGLRAAATPEQLEAAIQAPFKHAFRGRTWSQISKVRIEAGKRLVAQHPLGFYVPRLEERRHLRVCGETYKVGRGGNSTGVRYCWHYAGEWTMKVLRERGFSVRAAHSVWDGSWSDYPHRSLATVEKAFSGKIPDPELNVLIRHEGVSPVRWTVAQNNADQWDRRASRSCECGGTLFDWGGGHSQGFEFISWHCNNCPGVFTEYMTREQFYALRRRMQTSPEVISPDYHRNNDFAEVAK
jgi:hypothetical protein